MPKDTATLRRSNRGTLDTEQMVVRSGSVEMESCAPYNATEQACLYNQDCVYKQAIVNDWVRTTGGDDEEMKALGKMVNCIKTFYF